MDGWWWMDRCVDGWMMDGWMMGGWRDRRTIERLMTGG